MKKNEEINKVENLLGCLAVEISDLIRTDLNNGKNFMLVLNAYNQWREDECCGTGYIFNIHEKDDLAILVKESHLSAIDIANLVESNIQFCRIDTDANGKLTTNQVLNILLKNIESPVRCMLLYSARCGKDSPYALLYEEYVTSKVDEVDFREG